MPHVTIEHSANLADLVDIDELVLAVHAATLATGVAPADALRTRAATRTHYAIADLDPANAFVAVAARFGPGRCDDDKQNVLTAVLDALEAALGDGVRNVMLSAEFQEIDPTSRINRNHLRQTIADREGKDTNGSH